MKLIIKILFFVLSIFQTNICEAKVFLFSEVVTQTRFIENEIESKNEVTINIGNDVAITCKSGNELVNYRYCAVSVEAKAARTITQSLGTGRTAVKQWLQKAGTMERRQLVKDIQSAGFKLKTPAKSPLQVFERGGMRIRLDPIQRGAPYNHMHLEYGGESYNIFLNPVNYRSPAAHIPIR